MLEIVKLDALLRQRDALDAATMETARDIVTAVRTEGSTAVRHYAQSLDGLDAEDPLFLDRNALAAAFERLSEGQRGILSRTATRIRTFAHAQLESVTAFDLEVSGYRVGQECAPVQRAGCYAPGGRYPLPSSVLMTAVTARAAGVPEVVVASPRPSDAILGAAFIAGADGCLTVGGAHAIATLAYGIEGFAPCDTVVGPGNRFVTAAKQIVSGDVGIDMLAGPSELVVVADGTADPATVAADLIAQAEHDDDARAILIALDQALVAAVQDALHAQLEDLPTRETATTALQRSGALVCEFDRALAACDALAPEHLALHLANPQEFRAKVRNFGAVFEGCHSAEVFGDYGIGPNHVLPTGRAARYRGGLSVFDFLRIRTHVRTAANPDPELIEDVVALAEWEGLAGHARAAAMRR